MKSATHLIKQRLTSSRSKIGAKWPWIGKSHDHHLDWRKLLPVSGNYHPFPAFWAWGPGLKDFELSGEWSLICWHRNSTPLQERCKCLLIDPWQSQRFCWVLLMFFLRVVDGHWLTGPLLPLWHPHWWKLLSLLAREWRLGPRSTVWYGLGLAVLSCWLSIFELISVCKSQHSWQGDRSRQRFHRAKPVLKYLNRNSYASLEGDQGLIYWFYFCRAPQWQPGLTLWREPLWRFFHLSLVPLGYNEVSGPIYPL